MAILGSGIVINWNIGLFYPRRGSDPGKDVRKNSEVCLGLKIQEIGGTPFAHREPTLNRKL